MTLAFFVLTFAVAWAAFTAAGALDNGTLRGILIVFGAQPVASGMAHGDVAVDRRGLFPSANAPLLEDPVSNVACSLPATPWSA